MCSLDYNRWSEVVLKMPLGEPLNRLDCELALAGHIHLGMYLFGIVDVLKVNKGKTARASRSLVVDNIDTGQRAVTWEDLSQVSLCCVQTETKHTHTRVRVWIGL